MSKYSVFGSSILLVKNSIKYTEICLFSLQILFQHGSRNIVKHVGKETSLKNIIGELKQDLSINGDIVLQKYDNDWSEWVDLQDISKTNDKDKIKVVLYNVPKSASCDITNTNITNIHRAEELLPGMCTSLLLLYCFLLKHCIIVKFSKSNLLSRII